MNKTSLVLIGIVLLIGVISIGATRASGSVRLIYGGQPVGSPVRSCTETDSGNDPSTASTVVIPSGAFADNCVQTPTNSTLNEYYCARLNATHYQPTRAFYACNRGCSPAGAPGACA